MKLYIFPFCLASVFFASCVGANPTSDANDNDSAVVAVEAVEEYDSVAPIAEQQKSNWTYSESVDEMTDKTAYFATVESENSVDFDFPYEGGSRLTFTIRDSPQYGKDIYIKISKGQFNSGINGTNIKIRFDNNEAFTVHCNEASDFSSDILFLQGFNKLLKQVKDSKTMKINVEFFNEGTRTFTFNTEGLEWNH